MNARQRWQDRYDNARKRDADFTTLSGMQVEPAYGTDDSEWPGEFPFTRGIHASGYRGRPWTIRQFAGFGNAQQTNERYKMILGRGGGGLSVAFDMPTLMGRDSDDPKSLGEVGHCGVAIDSAADMEVLFDGIDLGDVTTSMTISGPAVPVFCMMLVAAERAGVDTGALGGHEHHAEDRDRRAADRHGGRDVPEVDAIEEHLHVGGAVDRDAAVADLAEALRVVGVAAHQGRHVEGDRQTATAAAQDHLVALVGLLGVAEAGELADRPRTAAVAAGVDAAGEGELPGPFGVVGPVRRLDLHAGERGEVGIALACVVVAVLPALACVHDRNTRTSN